MEPRNPLFFVNFLYFFLHLSYAFLILFTSKQNSMRLQNIILPSKMELLQPSRSVIENKKIPT